MSAVKMITKGAVMKIVGIAKTSPARLDLFKELNEYKNPYNSKAMFREDEVVELVQAFDIKDKEETV